MITLIKSELFKSGGLEKYTWRLARDFCALKVPVTLLTSGQITPPFQDPLLTIVSLPVSYSLSVFNLLHFDLACANYLKKHRTPVIFSLDRNRFQTHLRAGNGAHAAYLKHRSKQEGLLKRASFALNPLHHVILSLEKTGFEHKGLKLLFANSHMVKQEILRFYNVDPEKIVVVHNGVEWHEMHSSFESWEEGKEKLLPKSERKAFQFLFIGHNFSRKGLPQLLRALSHIKSEDFQLNIVGKEKNSKAFHQLVKELGLEKKVFFWGPQSKATAFYQSADCVVIPSLYDPFANVTLEALAMGVPVISSKHNGGHEILNSSNGSVIEELEDSRAFAEVLKGALRQPKTVGGALLVRESVKHLDFSEQLKGITGPILQSLVK
jgi:UDP-glucose:(heptosyl)LPS alpha-1,3-glucosyltransferase